VTKDLNHRAEPGSHTDLLDGAVWRISSFSGTAGNCVEVATNLPGIVAIRDSKDPEGTKLVVSSATWRAFIAGMREGEFEGS
jgi:hypothetical protein